MGARDSGLLWAQPDQGLGAPGRELAGRQYFATMQLWIKGMRIVVRADQVVAISLEGQDDPKLHLVRLETTGGQFTFGGYDELEEAWSTIDALVEMLTRCDQRNESGVITVEDAGKATLVEMLR